MLPESSSSYEFFVVVYLLSPGKGVSMRQRARLLPLLLLTLCMGIFTFPASSSASIHSVHKGKPHFLWGRDHIQPHASNSNLIYHGGFVQEGTTRVFAIFWEPTGSSVSSSYNDLLTRYFNDVGGSSLYHNNTQYTGNSGNAPQNATLAGTWVDTAPYSSTPILLDADIQNEILHAMTVKGWVAGVNHMFFVYLASNEILCFDSNKTNCSAPRGNFCSYHFIFTPPGSSDPVVYAAMPYDGNDLAACYALNSSPNNDIDGRDQHHLS